MQLNMIRARPFAGPKAKPSRTACVAMSSKRFDASSFVQKVVISSAAAALVLLGNGPIALAAAPTTTPNVAEEALEAEVQIETQKQQLTYLLERQELVKKAQLAAKRQALDTQVVDIQASLQKKIIEQKANAMAAKSKGNPKLAAALEAEAAEIEEKSQMVSQQAAKITANLSRAEILEKARIAAAKQDLQEAASSAKADVNLAVDSWLERSVKAKGN